MFKNIQVGETFGNRLATIIVWSLVIMSWVEEVQGLGKDEWGVFWYINWKEEFDGMGKGAGWGVGVSKIWAMFYWYVWEINQEISSWEQA